MNFNQIISNRRSTRKFQETNIEPEKIEQLKQAILLSPTGKSKNHWDFIFVQNPKTLAELSQSKEHASQLIASSKLAVVVVGSPTISDTWIEDCSIASIVLQLQAEDLELGSCWVQIHKRKHNENTTSEAFVKELLNIPEEKAVLSIIAIGYPELRRAPINKLELLFKKIHEEKF